MNTGNPLLGYVLLFSVPHEITVHAVPIPRLPTPSPNRIENGPRSSLKTTCAYSQDVYFHT